LGISLGLVSLKAEATYTRPLKIGLEAEARPNIPGDLCIAVMHLQTKFGGNSFIQSADIDIFLNSM